MKMRGNAGGTNDNVPSSSTAMLVANEPGATVPMVSTGGKTGEAPATQYLQAEQKNKRKVGRASARNIDNSTKTCM